MKQGCYGYHAVDMMGTPIEPALSHIGRALCRDLTILAEQGELEPVIGRDGEIRRVIQVLSRHTKNKPVLIGEPDVEKTAIVAGVAPCIVRGDIPEGLQHKRIVALDMGTPAFWSTVGRSTARLMRR